MKFFLSLVLVAALSACGPKPAEPSAEPSAELLAEEVVIESSEGVAAETLVFADEDVTRENLPGTYRDADAPEVAYVFRPDGTWQATWEPAGGPVRGLRMDGTYLLDGNIVGLQCRTFSRKDPVLRDYTQENVAPSPRPRAFFRMEGGKLIMETERTAEPFLMAPFSARHLQKVRD